MAGYRLRDLRYTVLFPRGSGTCGFKKVSGRGKALEAGADFVSMIAKGAFKYGVKRNVDRKLEEMYPDIIKALGDYKGVLVVVRYQEWKKANPELYPPELLSVSIGSPASNFHSAIRKWEQTPHLLQGVGDGRKPGPTQYLWFQKASTKKNDLKKKEALSLK